MEINQIDSHRQIKNSLTKQSTEEIAKRRKNIQQLQKQSEHEINLEKTKINNKIQIFHTTQAKRLQAIKKNYDDSIKVLKNRFDNELMKIKNSFLNSKKQIFGMDEDQFQNRIELNTKISDRQKHVEVEVFIPKAQASNLFTTVDKRKIKINLTRNFSDSYDESGEVTNFRKNQSVTKEVNVADILSEKNISKVIFEDKVVFKIPKA